MKLVCVVLIASICLLQCSEVRYYYWETPQNKVETIIIKSTLIFEQAKPAKKKEHNKKSAGMDIDPEEMMRHMSKECLAFMSKPE